MVEGREKEGIIKNDTELETLQPDVARKIEQVVKDRFTKSLKILRETKTDVIGIYDFFERQNRAEFEKFIENLDNPDDFLNYITFELIVKAQTQ